MHSITGEKKSVANKGRNDIRKNEKTEGRMASTDEEHEIPRGRWWRWRREVGGREVKGGNNRSGRSVEGEVLVMRVVEVILVIEANVVEEDEQKCGKR